MTSGIQDVKRTNVRDEVIYNYIYVYKYKYAVYCVY